MIDKTGLIIGKFYPPHLGHHQLINVALEREECENLVVLVAGNSKDSIPLSLRCRWIASQHPASEVFVYSTIDDVPTDYDDPNIWERHVKIFKDALSEEEISVIYSSEEYGPELARRWGSNVRHVMIDRDRLEVPISASMVRAGPLACWDFLQPEVKAHFTRRVVVLGAESTGTTTLAKALGREYGAPCVHEYGRLYAEQRGLGHQWEAEEFVRIAAQQQADIEWWAQRSGGVVICDTDALATTVFAERYLDADADRSTEWIAAQSHPDLYIVTSEHIPWVQDGTRDSEGQRYRMADRFREKLNEVGAQWIEVVGSHEARMETAQEEIDKILAKPYYFTEPI